jgi:type III pantothenate kinase
MNLAIDIGNTHIKFGLFNGSEQPVVHTGEDALAATLQQQAISHAIISKTGKNETVEQILQQYRIPTLVLSQQLKLPITIQYKTPHTLGADRVAGAVAAHYLCPGKNVLKIDFGTCITYDYVSAQSEYLGGAISPGMAMRFKALNNYTAKLPLIDPLLYTTYDLTGTDTATSILSGVVNGIKHEVTGIIKEYDERFGNLQVVVTGGNAPLFVTLLKCEIFARPYLVLEGLNRILNYNL